VERHTSSQCFTPRERALARGANKKCFSGTADAVPFQSKSGQVAEVAVFWETRAGAGLSPCFREKHAEPEAQDVIVSSLQDSVVAYL